MDAVERATWASKVKPARNELGWSQAELAKRAKVTRETVGNIESGQHTPQLEKLLAVLDALDISHDELSPQFDADLEALMVLVGSLLKRLPNGYREEWAERITVELAEAIRGSGEDAEGQVIDPQKVLGRAAESFQSAEPDSQRYG